jgi:PAS domain-containing protein
LRSRVVFPMQTLTNLLDALREGDYSVRSRRGRQSGALGEMMAAANELGETLLLDHQRSREATALLRAAMAEIDVAVFVFDGRGCLRLINRAGAALLDRPEDELLNRPARQIGLEEYLEGEGGRTVLRQFPGSGSSRWGLRRTGFREGGYPHQLLILVDLSSAFRTGP